MSRVRNFWERVDLVYGGVQKNLGPAGLAVVAIRRSALDEGVDELAGFMRDFAEAAG